MPVRPGRPSDAERVAEIGVAGWQAAYLDIFDRAWVLSDEFASQRLAAARVWTADLDASGRGDGGVGLLAHDPGDGRPIDGWCSYGPSRGACLGGEVWGLYVDPSAWGTGAGATLLGAATDALLADGHDPLELSCLAENPRALAFYRRCGWLPTGRRFDRDFGPAGQATEVILRRAAAR
jgi:GNAT superfamily N-acetyltransferase